MCARPSPRSARARPDAVVTIDSSGFTWRIAHRLRRAGETLPLIHYVAPMVWAWRAGRARRMARWYDHLLTLLPFEPPYFEREGLASTYVGHPVVDGRAGRGRRRAVPRRARHRRRRAGAERAAGQPRRRGAAADADLRRGAAAAGGDGRAVPGRGADGRECRRGGRRRECAIGRASRSSCAATQAKYDAFAASRAALAASGSVALELAMARLPMAVAYRLSPADRASCSTGVAQGAHVQSDQPDARAPAGARAVGAMTARRRSSPRRSPS